jgi:vacuolar-type H+-ATPase subunit C/Vma6
MSVDWVAAVTRARGLWGRLLSAEQLERLTRAPSLDALRPLLADALRDAAPPLDPSARALDACVRAMVVARMATLRRWCESVLGPLAVVFEDDERRAVRALLRGAAARVSAAERLACALPSHRLPAATIAELTRAATLREVVAGLAARGDPYGRALVGLAAMPEPSLWTAELLLSRTYANLARSSARGAGEHLMAYVREQIDLENTWSALLLASHRDGEAAEACFLEGGARVDRGTFLEAAAAPLADAVDRLAARHASGLAAALRAGSGDLPAMERRALEARADAQRQAARIAPLGPATILSFVLQLQLQALRLRQLVWSRALGARGAQV